MRSRWNIDNRVKIVLATIVNKFNHFIIVSKITAEKDPENLHAYKQTAEKDPENVCACKQAVTY